MQQISRRSCSITLLVSIASCLVGCQKQSPPTASRPDAQASLEISPTSNDVKPPSVKDGFLLRPTFETTLGTIRAGTAFSVKLPGYTRPVVLTAIHLLGPAGGLPRNVRPAEVPHVLNAITLDGCFDPSIHIAGEVVPLVIPEAGPFRQRAKAGDVLAFWGPEGSALSPSSLAAATAAKGDHVWLVAEVLKGAPSTQRLHAATVLGINERGNLVYRFDNPKLSMQATSGAPVLNAAGEIVAINLGSSSAKNTLYGFGNPVERFAPYLKAAMKRNIGED